MTPTRRRLGETEGASTSSRAGISTIGRAEVSARARSRRRRRDEIERGVIRDHHGERLRLAGFALPQGGDSYLVPRIADQVETANALQGDDLADANGLGDLGDRSREFRAASGTGNRLGMEAAVRWIAIVRLARVAHGEAGHRRLRAVVGQRAGNRVARPAMGAVGEGIAMKPRGGIEDLGKTLRARCGIRHDAGCRLTRTTRHNDKIGRAGLRQWIPVDRLDTGERRSFQRQSRKKIGQPRTFDLDRYAIHAIADKAREREILREAIDKRPHAHALHSARQPHADAADGTIWQWRGRADHSASFVRHQSLTLRRLRQQPSRSAGDWREEPRASRRASIEALLNVRQSSSGRELITITPQSDATARAGRISAARASIQA